MVYLSRPKSFTVLLIFVCILVACLPTPAPTTVPSSTASNTPHPPTAPITPSLTLTATKQPTANNMLGLILSGVNATQAITLTTTIEPLLKEVPPPGWIAIAGWCDGGNGIDIIHTSGKGLRRLTQAYYPQFISWSPDGEWIAYTDYPDMQNHSGSELYLTRPDGSEVIQLTSTSGIKGGISWSPDGQSIIYSQASEYTLSTEPEQARSDIFTVNIFTKVIEQITNSPEVYELAPSWSPHGDVIAFASIDKDGPADLYQLMVMDSSGSHVRHLADIHNNLSISIGWSPDGNHIVFSSGDECENLFAINQDGTGLHRLTDNRGDDYSATWSSDGKWIAFIETSPCNLGSVVGSQLHLIQTDNSKSSKLNIKPGMNPVYAAWSSIPGLQVGSTFTVTKLGNNVNLRSSPSLTSDMLMKLNEGEKILVLDGYVEADEFLWWKVRVIGSEQEGWVAENPGWFEP